MQTFMIILHIYFLVEICLTKGHLSLMFKDRVPLKFSNTEVWDQFTRRKGF